MATASPPNGFNFFVQSLSDVSLNFNQFLDSDGHWKWTNLDGTVALDWAPDGTITTSSLEGASISGTTGALIKFTDTTVGGDSIVTESGTAISVAGTIASTSNTAKAFVYSDASKILATTAAPTNGQLLIGDTGNSPALGTVAGTANQITATLGAHSITLSLSATLVAPGAVTVTTRTGTPATFACFDSGGKLVESATACA